MAAIDYPEIMKKLPTAFAYHKMLYNNQGQAIDYIFLDVNPAFETMTGLRKDIIIGKQATAVLPDLAESDFDWIQVYAKLAQHGGAHVFRSYSEPLDKWYDVTALSDKQDYFCTFFQEVTQDVAEKIALREIVRVSEQLLQSNEQAIDYTSIAEILRQISGARYVGINLYDDDGNQFTTVALAGVSGILEPVRKILGFNPVGKKWPHDPVRADAIMDRELTMFENLASLSGKTIPQNLIDQLSKRFATGRVYLARIMKDQKMLGDLTLMMAPETVIKNDDYVRVLASLLGQFLDRQKSQRQLLQVSEELEKFFQINLDLLCIIDEEGRFIRLNQAWEHILGYPLASLQGRNITEFIHPDDLASTQQAMKQLKSQKEVINYTNRYRTKDGSYRYIEWRSKPSGRLYYAAARDVTERTLTRRKLKFEHQQMLSIFDHMDALIYVVDMEEHRILYMNQTGSREIGDIEGKTCWQTLHPETQCACDFCPIPLLKAHAENKQFKNQREYYSRRTKRWYQATDSVIRWPDGRDVKLTVSYDITERRNAERQNRFISTAMLNAYDSVIVADASFHITYVNKSSEDLFGYQAKELIGKHVSILYAQDEQDKLHQEVISVLKQSNNYDGELINQRRDGSHFICELKVAPILDANGKPYAYVGTQRDVTEKREIERQRFLEREKFRTILLSVGDAIIATDKQGRIEVMNPVAEYLTGWTANDAVGRPLMEVFNIINELSKQPCDNPVDEVLRTCDTIELMNNTALIARSGQIIPVEDSAAPILDMNGHITGVVIVFRDYTEKRDKQREVEYLSFHDHLTGLYNRRYLEDAIQRLDVKRNLPFAILVLDVNGLKLTNDAFGHDMGDLLLKTVADIIKSTCRGDDIIARTGGDEFVVLLPETNEQQTKQIRQRIIQACREKKMESIMISVAIGYAVKIKEEQDIWEIMKLADNKMYEHKLRHGKIMRNQTIELVLRKLNMRYDNEQIHTQRVAQYCEAIARAMQLPEKEMLQIKMAAELHDIGKITVAPGLLRKNEPLTRQEWEEIKRHPVTGYNILKGVEEHAALAEIVLHHHERWDGSGYPGRLKGTDIPLHSRIITVADAYEAMTAKRPYQDVKSNDEAIAELIKYAGTQFDPDIVKVMVESVLK